MAAIDDFESEESEAENLDIATNITEDTEKTHHDNACDILCEALEKLEAFPQYHGSSSNCKDILTNLKIIKESISNNKHASDVITFANDLVGSLTHITNYLSASEKSKGSISKRSSRMWKAFHQCVVSESYKKKWSALFTFLNIKVSKTAVIIQHTAHVVAEILIQSLVKASDVESDHDLPPLTVEDDNAIRFASGFVVKSVKKKLEKSEEYLQVLECMHESDDVDERDEDNFLEYTREWITRIDRGGLFRVSDEAFLFLERWNLL